MFLLDTDTIIFSLKGHPAVNDHLRRHVNDPMKISVISFMELYYGAYKSQQVTSNLAKLKTLEQSFEMIPLGGESAEIFGRLKSQLEKNGTKLDDFDLGIASCALAHNLILVTRNLKHFQRIEGLHLVDWTQQGEPS